MKIIGEKGYKEGHEHEEGKKGHHDKEDHKKSYHEEEGGKKKHHDGGNSSKIVKSWQNLNFKMSLKKFDRRLSCGEEEGCKRRKGQ